MLQLLYHVLHITPFASNLSGNLWKMRNLGTRLKRKNKITDYSNIAASRCLKGYDGMTKILFVCHGNICRSPMAEYVMKDLVRQSGREDEFVRQRKALIYICILCFKNKSTSA